MSTPIRVLILEDRAADAELMLHELRKAGFDPNWQRVEAEPEYLRVLETNPDLILADWSLPQFNGQRALQLMNERGLDIPFIIVSGSIGEEAAVEAMRQGAADYLLKDRPARLGTAVQLTLNNKQLRDERRRAEVALAQQNDALVKLNHFSIDLLMLSAEDNLEVLIARQIKEITGAEVALFSKYNPADRTITAQHIEMKPGLLDKVVHLLGTQLKNIHSVVSDEMYREMTTEIIGVRRTLSEASFGAISPPVGEAIQALLKVDRFIGIAYLIEGKLYGTSLLGMSKNRPDPPRIILENFDSMAASSLRRKLAEEALRNSEKRYRDLTEFLPISVFEIDAAGQLVSFNQTALQVFGYDEKEYGEEMNALQFFLPEERQRVVENLGKVIQGISTPGQEFIMLRKDGSTFTGLVYASSIIHENRTAGIRGAIIDITERKRAAEELIKSEAKFRAIFDNASTGMFIVDLQAQKYFMCNSMCAKMLGYTKEEFLNQDVANIHPEEDLPFINEQIGKFIRGEEGIRSDIKFKRKNGSIFAADLSPALLIIGDKEYLLISFMDITERKQAEDALRDSEARYRALFQGTLDGILIADLESRMFMYANPAICRLLGYSEAELQTMGVSDIHPKADLPAVLAEFEAMASGDKTLAVGLPCLRKDGTIIYADISAIAMSIDGKVCNVGFFRDITERKQREEEIHSRSEELTTLYQLSRLLADASDLAHVIELVNLHAVESVHTTFACIALMEDGDLVMRAFYPVRVLDHEFSIGERQPLTALPVCQRVLDKNEPVILQAGSTEVSSLECHTLQLDFARSVCLVSLQAGDPSQDKNQALGLLILGESREEKREAFTPEKIRLVHGIGDQAAAAIRRMLLHEHAERRLQHLASLSEIDRTIASSFDLHVNLKMILQQILEQLEVDAADVLVLNHHLQVLEFAAGRGFQAPDMEHKRLRLGEGQAGRAALERQIVQIPDVITSGAAFAQPELLEAENVAAYFAVPLIIKGQVVGVLEICHRTRLNPNKEWLEFLRTLAGQAAIAIDNVQMFDSLQRSTDELELAYDATIEGWSHALDLRDKETEGHALRVTQMTVNLARSFGLDENELVQVRWGGLLHDIGKLGVPDGILLKPGPLTDEEWVVMKKHPTLAFEMLSPIRYLHPALDIPYCHHEWWDGSGYPRGLKGEQIPLPARIFSVVDVWDALTSDRPYRKAWTREKAKEYIQEQAGKQFDPKVVETFMKEELRS